MVELAIKIIDKNQNVKLQNTGENEVTLIYTSEYVPGDIIRIESSVKNLHVILQVDDALGPAFVYVVGDVNYNVPFGDKRISYSPKVFCGSKHYLYARVATRDEIKAYRNLALNVADQPGETDCYPHAAANVETRGEAVFAARNAIDGVVANASHGEWPFQSWGINRQDDATIMIDFGRRIVADRIILYTRADFPHDNWWTQVTLSFSDGSCIDWQLKKSHKPHLLNFEKKIITWVRLSNLIKSDDPSPFPALSQIEVYGTVFEEVQAVQIR